MERSYVIFRFAAEDFVKSLPVNGKKILQKEAGKNKFIESDRIFGTVWQEISRALDVDGVVIPADFPAFSDKKEASESEPAPVECGNGVSGSADSDHSALRKDYIADWSAQHFAVVFDPEGMCRPGEDSVKGLFGVPEAAHVVVILSERARDEQLAFLHSRKISYVFASEDQVPEEIDPEKALKKLYRLFSADRLLMTINGPEDLEDSFLRRFVNRGLVDEMAVLSGNNGQPGKSTAKSDPVESDSTDRAMTEEKQAEESSVTDLKSPVLAMFFADADGHAPELQDLGRRTFSSGAVWQRFQVKHRENLSKRKLYQTEIGPVCMTEREFEEYMEMRELQELKKGRRTDIIDI